MKEDKLRVSKMTTLSLTCTRILTITQRPRKKKRKPCGFKPKKQASKQTQLRKPVFLKISILSIQKCTWMALSLAVGDISTAVQQLSVELLWSKSS